MKKGDKVKRTEEGLKESFWSEKCRQFKLSELGMYTIKDYDLADIILEEFPNIIFNVNMFEIPLNFKTFQHYEAY